MSKDYESTEAEAIAKTITNLINDHMEVFGNDSLCSCTSNIIFLTTGIEDGNGQMSYTVRVSYEG